MIDVDRDHLDPLFTEEPRELVEKFRCHLATTNFLAGDALLFGISMMHSTLPNTPLTSNNSGLCAASPAAAQRRSTAKPLYHVCAGRARTSERMSIFTSPSPKPD